MLGHRVVDLTMPLDDHFRWQTQRRTTGPRSYNNPFQVTWLTTSVHAFTHLDTPRHILDDGFTTDDLTLDQVMGPAAVMDLSGDIAPDEALSAARLAAVAPPMAAGEIILFKTAWETHYPHTVPEYWTRAPYLTREASEWLWDRAPRAVAFDFPQDEVIRLSLHGETRPLAENVTHDVLLRRGVILVEYLSNTHALTRERLQFCALPLKIAHSDGAPARVIALEEP
ncbi:MAG: cyclase family protein [Candidatus Competibacterales bacterium]